MEMLLLSSHPTIAVIHDDSCKFRKLVIWKDVGQRDPDYLPKYFLTLFQSSSQAFDIFTHKADSTSYGDFGCQKHFCCVFE